MEKADVAKRKVPLGGKFEDAEFEVRISIICRK